MITPEDVVVQHAVEVVRAFLASMDAGTRVGRKTHKLYLSAVKLLTEVFEDAAKAINDK